MSRRWLALLLSTCCVGSGAGAQQVGELRFCLRGDPREEAPFLCLVYKNSLSADLPYTPPRKRPTQLTGYIRARWPTI